LNAQSKEALARALAHPRLEVVPLKGLEDQIDYVPRGATVTVTCSPSRGIEPTVRAAQRLQMAGLSVVPHISARLISGEAELRSLVQLLDALGLRELFVIGGDATEPRGPYHSALDLLRALRSIPSQIESIGVAAYPEHHPLVDDETMLRALLEKQPFAQYLVTQICFDAATITDWLTAVRRRGITLPVYIGLPGAIDISRLLRISMKIGVGDSLRFLSKQAGLATRLANLRGYRPDRLVESLARSLADPALDIRGLHLNTFNQIESTERWRKDMLRRLDGSAGSHQREAV
jgi:methylenetetrahydrofolate reductase (NADPH)